MPITSETDEDYLEDQQKPTKKEGDDDSGVGLLPKSVLMGKSASVGDKVTLEITAIHDDQIAVKYPGEETPDEGEGEDESAETSAEDEAAPAEPEPAPVLDENYD